MKNSVCSTFSKLFSFFILSFLLFANLGCSSDDESSNDSGYVKFYNASKNAPAVFLTVDENLDTSDDDEVEVTFSGIEYGEVLSRAELESQNYYFELAWQDSDSNERSELELIYQDSFSIKNDTTHFIVLNEDVTTPEVMVYDIPVLDDEDDDTYELFNIRMLNLHQGDEVVDVYFSASDETFNEAILFGNYSYQQLSENQKLDQGSYVFYLTLSGENEVIFQSSTIDYYYSAQYLMVIRENIGGGSSPYVLDKVTNSTSIEYVDLNAEAQFSVYNAIASNDLLPNYQNEVSVFINEIDESAEIEALNYGELSEVISVDNGDYSINLVANGQNEPLLSNHLLSLPENSTKTVFVYSDEENVDDDNDGDVDENGDGIVDEKEVTIHTLVVDNSLSESIYDHQVSMVNLVDSEDFSLINFYFVRADETIDTATYNRSLGFAEDDQINLKNNTYQVYVVAKYNSSDIILTSFELTLNENSVDQFLIIEKFEQSSTGYKATLIDQKFK